MSHLSVRREQRTYPQRDGNFRREHGYGTPHYPPSMVKWRSDIPSARQSRYRAGVGSSLLPDEREGEYHRLPGHSLGDGRVLLGPRTRWEGFEREIPHGCLHSLYRRDSRTRPPFDVVENFRAVRSYSRSMRMESHEGPTYDLGFFEGRCWP